MKLLSEMLTNVLLLCLVSGVLAVISPIPRSKMYESCIHHFSNSVTTDEQKDFACTATEKWEIDIKNPGNSLHLSEREWFRSLGSFDVLDPRWRNPCVRKEYRLLTDAERKKFHKAVNFLKSTKLSSGISQYDLFVKLHTANYAPGAHGGAAFFPWHREFLKRFELALRLFDPTVCLPYLDNTLDKQLDNPDQSILWSEDFLGNGNGFVTTGPFAHWKTLITGGTLDRNVESSTSNLMNDGVINRLLHHSSLGNISCQANCEFEAAHSAVHLFVGGKMASLVSAPEDPVFYLHHAFVDFVWELFRQQQNINPVNDYPNSNYGNPFNHPNANMAPFEEMTNKEGTMDYSNYYNYSPRPVCFGPNTIKGSKYVLCEANNRGITRPVSTLRKQKSNTCDSTAIGQTQNSYCVNGKCDTSMWSFIPVSVIYARSMDEASSTMLHSFPVHNNLPQYNVDMYSGMEFSWNNKTDSCSSGHCCKNSKGVHLHASGLNYQGSYSEFVYIDQRPLISSADACVGVPDPAKHGQIKVRLRAADSCGRVCQPYCAVHNPSDNFHPVSYQKCSGDIAVNSKRPLMYSNSLKEAVKSRWGQFGSQETSGFPVPKRSDDFVIFYCNHELPFAPDLHLPHPIVDTVPFTKPPFNVPNFPNVKVPENHFGDNDPFNDLKFPFGKPAEPEHPIIEPEPIIVRPEMPYIKTKPETPILSPELPVIEPERPIVKPEPIIVRPEISYIRSEPETWVVSPELPIVEPEWPIVKPEPIIDRPEIPYIMPESETPIVSPELPFVEPEPLEVKAEPPFVDPEPPFVKSEPPFVKSEPLFVKPEPPIVKPELQFIRPEPPVVKPIIKPESNNKGFAIFNPDPSAFWLLDSLDTQPNPRYYKPKVLTTKARSYIPIRTTPKPYYQYPLFLKSNTLQNKSYYPPAKSKYKYRSSYKSYNNNKYHSSHKSYNKNYRYYSKSSIPFSKSFWSNSNNFPAFNKFSNY